MLRGLPNVERITERQAVHKMYKLSRFLTVIGISVSLSLSALLPSFAGSEGRRNTAIVLTAATVHQFLNKKKGNAIVLGLASALAWKGYSDAQKQESRNRWGYYQYGRSRNDYSSRGGSNCRNRDYSNYRASNYDRSDNGWSGRGYSQPRGHAYGHYKNRGNGNGKGNDNRRGGGDHEGGGDD